VKPPQRRLAGAFLAGAGSRLLPASLPWRFFGAAVVFHVLAWLALLAPGGRLVAPVGGEGLQALEVVDVQAGPQGPIFNRQRLEGVAFVPLRSGIA